MGARALADRHERADNPEDDTAGNEGRLPTVGMDFAYLGSETDKDQLPVLVMNDSHTGSVTTQACPDKAMVQCDFQDIILPRR